jgi:penicillin-binding protein 1A
MRTFLKLSLLGLLCCVAAGVIGVIVLMTMALSQLPDHQKLATYQPPVSSRVYSSDGREIGLFARQNRIYRSIDDIPDHVIAAFMSAEDKDFYSHQGVDPMGVARAIVFNVTNFGERRMQGASTITQQVAENVLLADARPTSFLDRVVLKIKEALVSVRIEEVLSKDQIMEVYLNQIFLGYRSYGVEAASQTYFGKSVDQISIAEAAYLGALPKGPNNYDPKRHADRALARRNWVIDRMVVNGFIRPNQAAAAKAEPLPADPKPRGSWTNPEAGEFVEEVRRDLIRRFGEDAPYARGFTVRSTVDLDTQAQARQALQAGLTRIDPRRDSRFRGAVGFLNPGEGWQARIAAASYWRPGPRARLALVLAGAERYGLQDGTLAPVPQADLDWAARSANPLKAGDVVWLGRRDDGSWQLFRRDALQGALVMVNVHTGGVVAMAGGYEVEDSGFNRATQAQRQPGSTIKPLIYAAALESGMTPKTKISDARIRGGGWSPENADRRFFGMMPLDQALVLSRNTVTVRIARRIGMRRVADYARRFGVYDDLPNDLTMALGAGETTLLKMTSAFAVFPNGGRYIPPVFYDRLQDPRGITVWRADRRACPACDGPYDRTLGPPVIEPWGVQVVSARTAWEISSILRDAVTRGTGRSAQFSHPVAGKTGTTSDYKDAWFIGFTPSYATGVYVGYDLPRTIGGGASGGTVAAPIFRNFMAQALSNRQIEVFEPSPEVIQEITAEERMNVLAELQNNPEGAAEALARLRRGESSAFSDATREERASTNRQRRPRAGEARPAVGAGNAPGAGTPDAPSEAPAAAPAPSEPAPEPQAGAGR